MTSRALIDRLESVLSTDPDCWRAQCPVHQGRSRSLAVKHVDGAWLIHCFAGCEALDIVQSVGLNLSDLFDKTNDHRSAPVARQHRINRSARDTVAALQVPTTVMMMGVNSMLEGTLTADGLDEMNEAYQTTTRAMDSAGILPKAIEDINRSVRNAP